MVFLWEIVFSVFTEWQPTSDCFFIWAIIRDLCVLILNYIFFFKVMDLFETQRQGHHSFVTCQMSSERWRKVKISTKYWPELIKKLEWDINQTIQARVLLLRCLVSSHILQRTWFLNRKFRKFIFTMNLCKKTGHKYRNLQCLKNSFIWEQQF